MANKTPLIFMALGLSILAPGFSSAEEVYSAMESEEQGVANGSGLIHVTPDRPSLPQGAPAADTKKIARTLPKERKATQVRTAQKATPVSQVTRVAPRASFPSMEIRVARRSLRSTIQSGLRGAFDAVPSDQADSLVRRLKIVEALITRHGRAYDYRIHTVRELEAILASLDRPVSSAKVAPVAQTSRFPVEGVSRPDPSLSGADELPAPPPAAAHPSASEPEMDVKDVE